jgi:glycosyltransferase involved in cell wall biosynthesis
VPDISVILPVYNREAYVREAVESVLSQTVTDFELIIVDDGSTDASGDIIRSISDPRILLIRTENRGVAAARNLGLDRSTGRIITFIDSDDRWLPHYLQMQTAILDEEREVGLVFCNFTRFNESGDIFPDQFSFYQGLERIPSRPGRVPGSRVVTVPAFAAFMGLYDFPSWVHAIAVRREIVGNIRFPPLLRSHNGAIVRFEDLPFTARLFLRTNVAYSTQSLLQVRRHQTNLTVDVAQLSRAILNSLLSLDDKSLARGERIALRDRIARQRVAIGKQLLASGEVAAGMAALARAAAGGRALSSAKGLLEVVARTLKGA